MGNNDRFVAMRCFWKLSFIPDWICVAFWFHSVFFFYYTDSPPGCSYSRAWLALHPIPAIRSVHADLSSRSVPLSPEVSGQGSSCSTGTSTVSSNIHVPSWDSVFIRQCSWDLPFLFGFGWFYMFSNPSSFFFPYLIFYIKSWRFLSASVWPPNPINIRIFFPHLQNKQTIRRPASPQLFLTF